VDLITAFLFHAGSDDDPQRLPENANKSFQGSIVLGMGFTFDDTDKSGVANPISLMHELIRMDPRNAERIFPYIGGEEVNDSPTHAHHRYVINFGQMSEEEARQWPGLMAIVEEKVKPSRLAQKRDVRAKYWWRYGEVAPALYEAIRGLDRVLVHAFVSKYLQFASVSSQQVIAGPAQVFAFDSPGAWCILQSRVHEVWARQFASTLEDRLQYTPSDCFETFAFPLNWRSSAGLDAAGREYFDFRSALMVAHNEGLTKTYNRFHDPDEHDANIVRLRELHAAMDRAVLDAYGWTNIQPTCEFILDYQDEEDEPGKVSKRKKPWRYRWPDEIRDEVLGRMLALNAERAGESQTMLTTLTVKAAEGASQPSRPLDVLIASSSGQEP
jgi:hypothetical protein